MCARDIQADLEQFRRDGQYFQAHYDELLEQYPEQWVAIYNETVVATDDNLERIAERLARMGYRGKAYVKRLTREKKTLILSINGSFSTESGHSRPFVSGHVLIPSVRSTGPIAGAVDFLGDTGSDVTLLAPQDSTLLGIDLQALPATISAIGFGGSAPTFEADAVLTLDHLAYPLTLSLLVPESQQHREQLEAMPSVIGRDTLSHFALFMEERTSRVFLLEPQEADVLNLPA